MKLYAFEYRSYGHNELLAVMADDEDKARVLVDEDAKTREDTMWPDPHFKLKVYAPGEVVQALGE